MCGAGEDSWEPGGQQRDLTVNPKGNQPWIFIGRTDAKAEAPTLWPPNVKSQVTGKDPNAEKDWGQEEKGMTENEMVGWRHQLNGHESEQAPGDDEGQESLACCSPWDCKRVRRDWATEQQFLSINIVHLGECWFEEAMALNLS